MYKETKIQHLGGFLDNELLQKEWSWHYLQCWEVLG